MFTRELKKYILSIIKKKKKREYNLNIKKSLIMLISKFKNNKKIPTFFIIFILKI
jgi:hypothetical protein